MFKMFMRGISNIHADTRRAVSSSIAIRSTIMSIDVVNQNDLFKILILRVVDEFDTAVQLVGQIVKRGFYLLFKYQPVCVNLSSVAFNLSFLNQSVRNLEKLFRL